MTAQDRRALFVRLPQAQALQVDAAARRAGRTKQDYVAAVLTASLESAEQPCLRPVPGPDPGDRPEGDQVLTLQELADLLKLGTDDVLARVATGDLPGRRFSNQWRFSRAAVLAWLDGSDADRRQTGFRSRTQAPGTTPAPRRH